MKEATGELNATLVVVVAVGVLTAFFYFTIWPMLKANLDHTAKCKKAWCESEPLSDGMSVVCHIKGSDEEIICSWKNVRS